MAENGCKICNMFKAGINCKRLILRPLAQERPKRARPRRLFTRVRSQVSSPVSPIRHNIRDPVVVTSSEQGVLADADHGLMIHAPALPPHHGS